MKQICLDENQSTTGDLSIGVIAPTLTPFDEAGRVMWWSIADQAGRLARIEGIIGIAVNSSTPERKTLSATDRLEVVRRTRSGLDPNQLLINCVGELSDAVVDDAFSSAAAGADAVITFLPKWQKSSDSDSLNARVNAVVDLVDRLSLPVIVALEDDATRHPANNDEIATLAQHSRQVIGFDMGADDNVLHYDQDYYALKADYQPLACLPSSEGALFHNLSTGADGVLSFLAYVAPHEVAALYQASRNGRFHAAQTLHNRLSPLIALLSGHGRDTSEMIYREAAHYRGLLASPDARGITEGLGAHLKHQLHEVIDGIGLKPISWV